MFALLAAMLAEDSVFGGFSLVLIVIIVVVVGYVLWFRRR
jgi:hypothetical protein